MQCWLDVARKLGYMSAEMYVKFDQRFERVISQLVTMIKNADKWCSLKT